MYLDPVEYVIAQFKGVRRLARVLDIDPSAISKWRKRGVIPSRHRRLILAYAARHKINITSHNLDYGGVV